MKIIFNDGQELTVQDASIQADGGLLVKTISATEDEIKAIFFRHHDNKEDDSPGAWIRACML